MRRRVKSLIKGGEKKILGDNVDPRRAQSSSLRLERVVMLLDFQLMGFPRCVWRSTSLPLLSLPFLSLCMTVCVRVCAADRMAFKAGNSW